MIFNWTQSQQTAFETKHLKSDKILQDSNFSKPFILTTNACSYAIGAILSQSDVPVAYASRTLNRAESNYFTTERELIPNNRMASEAFSTIFQKIHNSNRPSTTYMAF